jgi:Spy/CpxP family protein refolding chaperone
MSSLSLASALAQASKAPAGAKPDLTQPSAAYAGAKPDVLGIYREAGIDANQESKIRQLAKDFDSANTVKLHRLVALLHDLKILSLSPELDEKAALAKQDEINKIQADSANDRVRLLVKIRNTLNPEQKKKLVELMKKSMDQSSPAGLK